MKYHNDITQRMGDVILEIKLESNSEAELKSIVQQVDNFLKKRMSSKLAEVKDYFGAEDIYSKSRADLYEKPLKARIQLMDKAMDSIKDIPEECWEFRDRKSVV